MDLPPHFSIFLWASVFKTLFSNPDVNPGPCSEAHGGSTAAPRSSPAFEAIPNLGPFWPYLLPAQRPFLYRPASQTPHLLPSCDLVTEFLSGSNFLVSWLKTFTQFLSFSSKANTPPLLPDHGWLPAPCPSSPSLTVLISIDDTNWVKVGFPQICSLLACEPLKNEDRSNSRLYP